MPAMSKTDIEIALAAGIPLWLNEADRIAAIAQIRRTMALMNPESRKNLKARRTKLAAPEA